MSTFTVFDLESGEGQCDGCSTIYLVVFQRNIVFDRMEYCPFCGDEIEKFKQLGDE